MQGLCSNSALLWAPEMARVREPLLILSARLALGEPRECRGYVAIPPSCGPPRKQG